MAEEYTVNFNLLQDATRTAATQGATNINQLNENIQRRKDNAVAANQRQKNILALLGIQVSIAALLKNSQIFTNSLGALFQIIGAAIDTILAPLAPLIATGLSALANFLPTVARISEATFPRLVALFQGVGQILGSIAGALGNVFRPIINLFDKDGVSADGRLRLSDIITGLGAAALGPGIVAALQTGSSAVVSNTVFSMMTGTVSRLNAFVRSAGFVGLLFSGVNIAATFREQGIEQGIKALGRFFVITLTSALGAILGSMFGVVGTIIGSLGGAVLGGNIANALMGGSGVGAVGAEINTGGVRGGRSDYGDAIGAVQSSQMYPQSASAGFIGSQEVTKFGIDRQSARLGATGGY